MGRNLDSGKDTPDNVYKRMREGWEPRKAETVKGQLFPTINHGQWAGCIGIEECCCVRCLKKNINL